MKDWVENFNKVRKIVCMFYDGNNFDETANFIKENSHYLKPNKIIRIARHKDHNIEIIYKIPDYLNVKVINPNTYIRFVKSSEGNGILIAENKDEFESNPAFSPAGEMTDGYHTFDELYEYRLLYNAAFFNELSKRDGNPCKVIKSKLHSDGQKPFGGGWFIVMATLPTGQISNHYELKDWDKFKIPEMQKAYKWDGHTPKEASKRLEKFIETEY